MASDGDDLTPMEVAELLHVDDLKVGSSRKVNAPYRDDTNASLNVTRKQRTFVFCDHGIEYSAGETLAALRTHYSSNGSAPVEDDTEPEVDARIDFRWYAEYLGIPLRVFKELEAEGHLAERNGGGVAFLFPSTGDAKVRIQKAGPKKFMWGSGADNKAKRNPIWPEPDYGMAEEIVLVEGESACLTSRHLSLVAYTITGGANSAISAQHWKAMRGYGLSKVTLIGDGDDAGQTWADTETDSALAAQLEVSVCNLSDLFDPWGRGAKDVDEVYRRYSDDTLSMLQERTHTLLESTRQHKFTDSELISVLRDKPIPWLIPDLFVKGDKVLMLAPQKSFKTWTCLDLTRAVATGTRFLNYPVWETEQGNVLYVQEEGSQEGWMRRRDLVFGRDTDFGDSITWWLKTGFSLTRRTDVDSVIALVRERNIVLVILDPLQNMIPGVNENLPSEMSLIWDEVARIAKHCPHTVVLVVHHTNRARGDDWDSIRGATTSGGRIDVGLFLDVVEPGTLALRVRGRELPPYMDKKDGALEVAYELDPDSDTYKMDATGVQISVRPKTAKDTGQDNRATVLDALVDLYAELGVAGGESVLTAKIVARTGFNKSTVLRHLQRLQDEGYVETAQTPGGSKGFVPLKEAL